MIFISCHHYFNCMLNTSCPACTHTHSRIIYFPRNPGFKQHMAALFFFFFKQSCYRLLCHAWSLQHCCWAFTAVVMKHWLWWNQLHGAFCHMCMYLHITKNYHFPLSALYSYWKQWLYNFTELTLKNKCFSKANCGHISLITQLPPNLIWGFSWSNGVNNIIYTDAVLYLWAIRSSESHL